MSEVWNHPNKQLLVYTRNAEPFAQFFLALAEGLSPFGGQEGPLGTW